MESQQVVDYINEQLRAGHTEANVRAHMQSNGWSPEQVDTAFQQRQRAEAPQEKRATPTRKLQSRLNLRKSTRPRWIKLGIGLTAAAIAIVVTHGILVSRKPAVVQAAAPRPLTIAQKQLNDVLAVAGSMSQYVAANDGVQPNRTVLAAGGLQLCAAVCDPTASQVGPLSVYKPSGIHFAAYAPGLAAPDIQTMYLVPGAECKGKPAAVVQSADARSVVLLYAVTAKASLAQHCVQL